MNLAHRARGFALLALACHQVSGAEFQFEEGEFQNFASSALGFGQTTGPIDGSGATVPFRRQSVLGTASAGSFVEFAPDRIRLLEWGMTVGGSAGASAVSRTRLNIEHM
jgi:hypothetical protein